MGWYPYSHNTCFHCRKVFAYGAERMICPQCGGPLHDLGRHFKAPRRNDLKQWQKVERLFQHGYVFDYNRSDYYVRLPKRLNEVDAFLEANEREKRRHEAEHKRQKSLH